MNYLETDNSYFETQNKQRENILKPVTTYSLFPAYELVLSIITRLGPAYDPV